MLYPNLIIEIPEAFVMPKFPDGSVNPHWELVTTLNDAIDSQRTGSRFATDGVVRWNGQLNITYFTVEIMQLIVANGGDVQGYPAYFEVDLNSDVPDTIPGNKKTNEDGSETQLTWQTWSKHDPYVADNGNTYVSSAANSGVYLAASTLISSAVPFVSIADLPSRGGNEEL